MAKKKRPAPKAAVKKVEEEVVGSAPVNEVVAEVTEDVAESAPVAEPVQEPTPQILQAAGAGTSPGLRLAAELGAQLVDEDGNGVTLRKGLFTVYANLSDGYEHARNGLIKAGISPNA